MGFVPEESGYPGGQRVCGEWKSSVCFVAPPTEGQTTEQCCGPDSIIRADLQKSGDPLVALGEFMRVNERGNVNE
jgi:hypothetical protein